MTESILLLVAIFSTVTVVWLYNERSKQRERERVRKLLAKSEYQQEQRSR